MFRMGLILLLVAHTVLTFYFLRNDGFFSVFPPFKQDYAWQIFSDLAVSISLVLFFIFRELRIKKQSLNMFYILVVATILVGSFAPLIYLLINKNLFKDQSL